MRLPRGLLFWPILMGQMAGGAAWAEDVLAFETKAGALTFSADDIAEAAPQFGAQGAGLMFALNKGPAAAFTALTEASVGQRLTMLICGEVVVSAVLQERLSGTASVPLESLGEATWFAARLSGEEPCDHDSSD